MSGFIISNAILEPLIKSQNEIIAIMGFVKSVNINNKTCNVQDIESKQLYNCTYEGFLPVTESDVLYGYIVKSFSNYQFVKKPLVKVSVDKETIVKSMCKSLKYQINNSLANKLYDSCLINAEGETVDEYLDKMAIDLHEKQIENFGVLPNFLMETQVMRLLKWWYKSRTLRKLYLLGLNNKEIKNSELIMSMTPSKIYDHCMVDPFLIIPIPIDKCKTIYDSMGKQYTEDQLYRASIVRTLYHNNVDKAWTGTPSRYIISQYKDINKNIMQKLKEDYGVVGDLYTVYLGFHYKVETTVAETFSNMIKLNESGSLRKVDPVWTNPNLTDEQKSAISIALNSALSIISGGPGTGKTSTIKDLIDNLESLGISYQVAAFTGKAVARIKEVLKKKTPATLHMLITRRKQVTPFKFLIIDEASMVTTELFYYFCKAFGTDYQLCLVGDVNQLQPITYGNMFTELIKSQCVKPIYLTKNHRCKNEGMENNDLLHNVELMVRHYNQMLYRAPDEYVEPLIFKEGNNFFKLEGTMELVFQIVKLLSDRGIRSKDIMVITPYTKYLDEINRGCQNIYNVGARHIVCPRGVKYSVGDIIRMTSNNYNLGLMNSDSGVITDINPTPGKSGYPELIVEFDSGISVKFDVTYDEIDVEKNLTLALGSDNYTITNNPTLSLITHNYGCTIHCSQGSEYSFVIIYIPREDKMSSSFINFNLLYTALSRARNSAFLIGDYQSFELHCATQPPFRVDNMSERIIKLIEKESK